MSKCTYGPFRNWTTDTLDLMPDLSYGGAMFELHGLEHDPDVPVSLTEFAGEVTEQHRFDWLDRVCGWRDEDGQVVLTCEPYDHVREPKNALALLQDVAKLSLVADVHPGVWNDGTVLLMFRRSAA